MLMRKTKLKNTSGEEPQKEVNTKLREARVKRLWPIKTAARRAQVSESTYIRWEQKKQMPQLVNLQLLCNAFGMSAEELGYEFLEREEGTKVQPNKPSNVSAAR